MSQAVLEKRASPRGAGISKNSRPRSRARRTWIIFAACRHADPELFYACQSATMVRQARQVCAGCPVRQECLEAVMEEEADPKATPGANRNSRFGVRAGLTSEERWAIAYPKEAAREKAAGETAA